jgi:hypothetical protein
VFVRCKALQTWLEKGRITMLFYLTMFIVSLILAIVILWFYRVSADTSKAIYTTIIPSRADESPSDHLNDTVAHKTRTDAESPLGMKSHQTPRNLARTHRAKSIEQTSRGWPYREDMMRTGGKVYKLTRKVSPPKKTNLKAIRKPWGW